MAGTVEKKLASLGITLPTPASPIANRGWAPQADRQLRALGLAL